MKTEKEYALQYYNPYQPVEKYRGLINLGQSQKLFFDIFKYDNNTNILFYLACYMNSYIQCLFFTKIFKRQILSSTDLQSNPNLQTLNELKNLFQNLQSTAQHSILPQQFRQSCPEPFRSSQIEQDTSEFGKIYIDSLEKVLKFTRLKDLIQQCFFGKLQSNLKCTKCMISQTKEETFSDLTIHFLNEAYESATNKYNFQKMMQHSFKIEHVSDYICPNCQSKQIFEKQTIIKQLPIYLIITLNRFQFNNQTQQRQKIMEQIEILSKFHVTQIFPDSKILINNMEGSFYLYAIIMHIGNTIDSGHYLAIVRESVQSEWFMLNDTKIQNLSKNLNFNNLSNQLTPYMLFYANVAEKPINLQSLNMSLIISDQLNESDYEVILKK